MSLSRFDSLFFKDYDKQGYNCLHFTVDVWKSLFGIDVSFILPKESTDIRFWDRTPFKKFKLLKKAKNPCFVLLRSTQPTATHFATFIDNKILHITEQGVQYLPPEIISVSYNKMLYYEYSG